MRSAAAVALCLGCLILAHPGLATAEPYFAIYGGKAVTPDRDIDIEQGLTDVNGSTLATLDGSLKNVEFDNSPILGIFDIVGLKLGHFFPRRLLGGNFGFEYELYHFQPKIDDQTIDFSGDVCNPVCSQVTTTQLLGQADVSVITAGFNILYRLPVARTRRFPRGVLQPYVGVGAGAFIAWFETESSNLDVQMKVDDTDFRFGAQGLAGLRLFLTRNIALFGEYRYVYTDDFEFALGAAGTVLGTPVQERTTLRTDLSGHHFNAGISLHF